MDIRFMLFQGLEAVTIGRIVFSSSRASITVEYFYSFSCLREGGGDSRFTYPSKQWQKVLEVCTMNGRCRRDNNYSWMLTF